MQSGKTKFYSAIAILIILHLGWTIGYSFPKTLDLFKSTTPFLIAVSCIVVFSFHRQWNKDFLIFMIGTFLLVNIIALTIQHTDFIIGPFNFGNTLGTQLFEVPLIYWVLWLNIVYCVGSLTRKLRVMRLFKAFIGAVVVLILDIAIEPVAVKFDFWNWETPGIPYVEYIYWFLLSFILLAGFHLGRYHKINKLAPVFYIITLIFFAYLNYTV